MAINKSMITAIENMLRENHYKHAVQKNKNSAIFTLHLQLSKPEPTGQVVLTILPGNIATLDRCMVQGIDISKRNNVLEAINDINSDYRFVYAYLNRKGEVIVCTNTILAKDADLAAEDLLEYIKFYEFIYERFYEHIMGRIKDKGLNGLKSLQFKSDLFGGANELSGKKQ